MVEAAAISPRSTGCGKANPPSGDLTIAVMGQTGKYVLSLPSNYAPGTAYPLGFAFHGRGRTGPDCQQTDCIGFQSVMQDQAVLVYMTSLGGDGWEALPSERPINVAFFQAVLAKIEDSYCIDQNRIFVAGTSSGAHFTNILACRFGDKLLAASPVAGSMIEKTNCVGQVAALVIHGIIDSHVPFADGQAARDFYLMQNGCSNASVPTVASAHASVVATPESHQCVTYQGCEPGLPVVWCEHSEGGYDGSTHGWPKFAGQQIWDFVKPL
jgi:poly(3-hydroxybutyrate) depolymerase